MKKLKLLYVHGYMGSAQGNAYNRISNALNSRGIAYTLSSYNMPLTSPRKMRAKLSRLIRENEYDYIISSSMGALYVLMEPGISRILINPGSPVDLRKIRDEDPAGNPKLTDELLENLNTRLSTFLERDWKPENAETTHIIYGTRDTVAHNEPLLSKWYSNPARIHHVDMEHRVNETGAEKVCDILVEQYL